MMYPLMRLFTCYCLGLQYWLIGSLSAKAHEREAPATSIVGQSVQILQGQPLSGFTQTTETRTVKSLLCPLESVSLFQCIGIKYHKHAQESNFHVPKLPVIFTKPSDLIAGPLEPITVHHDAQSELDHEGELCFVISKDCKDVPEAEASQYILGYVVGNDLSARNYIPHEVSRFQMSYGKSFDEFAPLGPYVVSPAIVGDPHNLRLTTKVNNKTRRDATTSDMIWYIPRLIAQLTLGRTVRAGTVVMMGTPSGVGWFMQPQGYVQSGDIVEVSIEKLGSIRNEIMFICLLLFSVLSTCMSLRYQAR